MLTFIRQRPWIIAVLLSLVLLVWLLSGPRHVALDSVEPDQPPVSELARVEVRWLQAQPMQRQLTVQGQIEAWRRVELRAQVSATVRRLDQDKGQQVAEGQLLLTLSEDERPAQLARSEADVRQRENDLTAAQRLLERKLISANELVRLESELAKARADLQTARLQLAHTRIHAPFAGVYDQRLVEPGDFVQPGQSLLTLVDTSRLKVSAQVAQQQVEPLQVGQPVTVELLDGRQLSGTLHFIAAAADPGSRSFRIEVAVDNPEGLRLAGASATLRIATGETLAHQLSPALLSLDAQGRQGVKWVNEAQRVEFTPIQLLSADHSGAWVSGLPERVALITVGQGFVEPGQQVEVHLTGAGN